MTHTEQPATPPRSQTPGWPPWRNCLFVACTLTTLGLVAVHAWHAASPTGVPIALLGLSRLFFAVAVAVWSISEVVHRAAHHVTAAVLNHIDRHVVAAVDQARRELAADMARPLGHLADAVDRVSERVDALAPRVDEHGDRRYLEGTQQVLDSLTPGGDVLPLPRRHAGLRNGGPVV